MNQKLSSDSVNVSSRPTGSDGPAPSKDVLTKARQPAGAGKLQEIDLGPDTTKQNVLRTQAAVFGESIEDIGDAASSKKGRRRRQRRTSDDIKRDQMVEKILAEAKRLLHSHA